MGFPGGSDDKESAWNTVDPGLIPEPGRSPGEGNGYPLQYSCLENSMDRGAWLAGNSSWGSRESNMTEWLTLCVMYSIYLCTNKNVISVQFSYSVMSDCLWPHRLQHTRVPCPSPTPGAYSNSWLLSSWWHPAISSSVAPFSSCLQSFPPSGSFQMSQFFTSGGQNIGASASASILPMNIQDWFPLGWTGWISLQSKGPSRVFSNTPVQKHQVFSAQLS